MIHFCITCEIEEGEIQYLDHTRKQENRKAQNVCQVWEKKYSCIMEKNTTPLTLQPRGMFRGAALGAMLFPLEFSRQFPYPQNLKKEGKMGKNMEKEDKSGEKGKN